MGQEWGKGSLLASGRNSEMLPFVCPLVRCCQTWGCEVSRRDANARFN